MSNFEDNFIRNTLLILSLFLSLNIYCFGNINRTPIINATSNNFEGKKIVNFTIKNTSKNNLLIADVNIPGYSALIKSIVVNSSTSLTQEIEFQKIRNLKSDEAIIKYNYSNENKLHTLKVKIIQ